MVASQMNFIVPSSIPEEPVLAIRVQGDTYDRVQLTGRGNLVKGTGAAAGVKVPSSTIPLISKLTLTNELQAEGFIGADNSYIYRADLAGFYECRLKARVQTASASANTPKIYVEYFTSFSTTVGDYLTLGSSAVEVSIAAAGVIQTSWIPLVAGAKISDCYLALLSSGGNGVAAPVIGYATLELR